MPIDLGADVVLKRWVSPTWRRGLTSAGIVSGYATIREISWLKGVSAQDYCIGLWGVWPTPAYEVLLVPSGDTVLAAEIDVRQP